MQSKIWLVNVIDFGGDFETYAAYENENRARVKVDSLQNSGKYAYVYIVEVTLNRERV